MSQRINRQQFEQRFAELCATGTCIFPRRVRDRHILWESIILGLDPSQSYTEKEIDRCITHWLSIVSNAITMDHVNLRRQLVDERYLERTADGAVYRVSCSGPNVTLFEPAVEAIDIQSLVVTKRAEIDEKKRTYFESHANT